MTKKIKYMDHGVRLLSGLMIILRCIVSATKHARTLSRHKIGNASYMLLRSYYRSQFNLRTSLQGPVKQKFAGLIAISVA